MLTDIKQILGTDEHKKIIQEEDEYCISIYMPIYRAGGETRKNPIILKNLAGEAKEKLIARGAENRTISRLMAPVEKLEQGDFFIGDSGRGLALFSNSRFFVQYRLPRQFNEKVHVAGRFYIKPLIPLMNDHVFFILALSQNRSRLLKCNSHDCREISLPGAPDGMDEIRLSNRGGGNLQFHTDSPSSNSRRSVAFHGQLEKGDDENIRKYLRLIDRQIVKVINDEKTPLVLAGVDNLVSSYQIISKYPSISNQSIAGNPEEMHKNELHEKALGIIKPVFMAADTEELQQFERLMSEERAVDGICDILPAVHDGRVSKLFVLKNQSEWGRYDPEHGEVSKHCEMQQGDVEVLNLAIGRTLDSGGDVFIVNSLPVRSMAADKASHD